MRYMKTVFYFLFLHLFPRGGLPVRQIGNCTANVYLLAALLIIMIIMYIYRALINALSAHMIHIDLNMIFCTHVEHSPTKTI